MNKLNHDVYDYASYVKGNIYLHGSILRH
ncbi:hypothetical protein [Enterococcus faecalis]